MPGTLASSYLMQSSGPSLPVPVAAAMSHTVVDVCVLCGVLSKS